MRRCGNKVDHGHGVVFMYKKYYMPYVKKMLKHKKLKIDDTKGVCNTYDVRDKKLYKSVCRTFNIMMMDAIYRKGVEFVMPFGLGTLRMYQYDKPLYFNDDNTLNTKKNKIDFYGCWKLWEESYPGLTREEISRIKGKEVVVHLNEHNPGIGYYLKWGRYNKISRNRAYSFDRLRGDYGMEIDGRMYYYGNRGFSVVLKDDNMRIEYPIISYDDVKRKLRLKRLGGKELYTTKKI